MGCGASKNANNAINPLKIEVDDVKVKSKKPLTAESEERLNREREQLEKLKVKMEEKNKLVEENRQRELEKKAARQEEREKKREKVLEKKRENEESGIGGDDISIGGSRVSLSKDLKPVKPPSNYGSKASISTGPQQ
ncbi:hypothetical protein O9G_005436 [Rozella allomycis CSF55]|uniref:Uncharacterized protein n=1 Tax=Rozella allomycis (strain CSF55) TaxID=988480 RepID=A0A075B1M1_ROZAC|nr:hypothetical protein O9G_005436 [Rozella allomycis CSF55]|eukprot:EPZ36438.1 hypothetical protein O9G_005436 [Rozella allomycis CSF55]